MICGGCGHDEIVHDSRTEVCGVAECRCREFCESGSTNADDGHGCDQEEQTYGFSGGFDRPLPELLASDKPIPAGYHQFFSPENMSVVEFRDHVAEVLCDYFENAEKQSTKPFTPSEVEPDLEAMMVEAYTREPEKTLESFEFRKWLLQKMQSKNSPS